MAQIGSKLGRSDASVLGKELVEDLDKTDANNALVPEFNEAVLNGGDYDG